MLHRNGVYDFPGLGSTIPQGRSLYRRRFFGFKPQLRELSGLVMVLIIPGDVGFSSET